MTPSKIVSIDPWGASVQNAFADYIEQGYDIRPTIAVTKAHIHLPEIKQAIAFQRLAIDGAVLHDDASAAVTKIAIEPVWWLPGVAARFNVSEADLRRALFEETGGMYPELVTRGDLDVFLPPIGGQTLYVFGDVRELVQPGDHADRAGARRVQRLRTCSAPTSAPAGRTSTHAIEECIQGAQRGGVGLIAYSRKEGRALGEVTKFLVYNARKRQEGGDRADKYFAAHRVRGRRAGHALPGADARRAALAGHPQDPPPGQSMSNMTSTTPSPAAASRSASASRSPTR